MSVSKAIKTSLPWSFKPKPQSGETFVVAGGKMNASAVGAIPNLQ